MSLRIDFIAPGVLRKGLEKNRKGMMGTGQTLKKKENRRTESGKEKKPIGLWPSGWADGVPI